ncbi:4a-hydroxytetrahydrobiopterin dehydratase [Leptothoe sp. PORK10 BA2]|uniref:4a-hydroxytetrahydrobiopterin dehydratase n=1 Tax=Leptothoe sp. PORK10 BA2 TaxID=3110254 RepID=UPI002B208FB4|nr:4a-hydroxytetrahydrobiopterin dehydratase [Leptothoe sp. PORK10 BA2]MEA5462775.1 4a-hydroxytetrahydrobiopterin dehydratase [Leptothoe sp. PORK10 BA2]
MSGLLSAAEIQSKLAALPDWMLEGKTIQTTLSFKNFIEAVEFINRVVQPAEATGHHPDLAISYNKVTISLTTHDAGGLTRKDFDMAQTLSALMK